MREPRFKALAGCAGCTLTPSRIFLSRSLLHSEQPNQRRISPTCRRVLRDGGQAPMEISRSKLASDPELSEGGLSASDKGFLVSEVK